jgi:hypothetical protein
MESGRGFEGESEKRAKVVGRERGSESEKRVKGLLVSMAISDPDFGFGVWIQGVCADILSHTWLVRGGDQPRTAPMPFQRISTDLCGSPDPPRRAETAERATWGTKTPLRPPTAGTPPAPARVRRKPRRWDPLVPIWGGSPVAAPRPPAPRTPDSPMSQCTMPLVPPGARPNGTVRDIGRLPPACRVTKNKK